MLGRDVHYLNTSFLCIEISSTTIFKDREITGIRINGKEYKRTMFADDDTFAMGGSLKSLQKLICILDDFKLMSGLKLNVKATTILRVGSEIHIRSTLRKYEIPVAF